MVTQLTYRTSILIRTLNEQRALGATLDAVLTQTEPPHEIIVIDSGSTDRTVEIARSHPVKVLEIPPEEWGYSYALNVAAREATGDVLVCLSAHCLPVHDDWLATITRHFDDPVVAGVWGPGYRPGRPLPPIGPPTRQVQGDYTAAARSWGLNNANSALRRVLWLDHPFDEQLPAAEDKAWGMDLMELGYEIVHDPAAGVYHERHSPASAFKRARAVEEGFARMFPGVDSSERSAATVIADAARDRLRAHVRKPDPRQFARDIGLGLSAASAVLGIRMARRLHLRSGTAAPGVPLVSVVVLVPDAGPGLHRALRSLQAQTLTAWEAIVVHHGSSEGTASAPRAAIGEDGRMRIVTAAGAGASTARNLGLQEVTAEWVLFLDADDWIGPRHLEDLHAPTADPALDPTVDVIQGGWQSHLPDGTVECWEPPGIFEPADTLRRGADLPVHATLVRRSGALGVGGFDESLTAYGSVDFRLRIVQSDRALWSVAVASAHRDVRVDMSSRDPHRLLAEGLEVIHRAHAVPAAASREDPGSIDANRADALLDHAVRVGGMMLAQGADDPSMVLASLPEHPRDHITDPARLARALAAGLLLGRGAARTQLGKLWDEVHPAVEGFVLDVCAHAGVEQPRRFWTRLVDVIATDADPVPLAPVGTVQVVAVEVTEPLADVVAAPGTDRVAVVVRYQGQWVGVLQLPVYSRLCAHVIADAIAARHAWPLLEHDLAAAVYPELDRVDAGDDRIEIRRAGLVLGTVRDDEPSTVHDEVGWTVMLQELWSLPDWGPSDFYDGDILHAAGTNTDETGPEGDEARGDAIAVSVEIASGLPTDLPATGPLAITVTIGGTTVARLPIAGRNDDVTPEAVCRYITAELGFELCIAATREAVIGSGSGSTPLARRLRERANAAGSSTEPIGGEGVGALLTHRGRGWPGTSSWRRARLPAELCDLLERDARDGEAELVTAGGAGTDVRYCPELQPRPYPDAPRPAGPDRPSEQGGLLHFEATFARKVDPWEYESPYEVEKYDHTLEVIGTEATGRALEIGCAEGHFTTRLATRAASVLAVDISTLALERAQGHCSEHPNVTFLQGDVTEQVPEGEFDLVVCSELLYYIPDETALARLARRLSKALKPGGRLVCAHANLLVDEPGSPGFAWDHPFGAKRIGEILTADPDLALVRELQTPLYRIQRFELAGPADDGGTPPAVTEIPMGATPEPAVAAKISWGHAGSVRVTRSEAPTPPALDVPILTYHRIAEDGPAALSPYRVSPELFERHVAFLADAEVRVVTLADVAAAVRWQQPIGRAVVLTFDDGYADFRTNAFPVLQAYGFPATVFVVTGLVGGESEWDARYGGLCPLLDWSDLQTLQDHGVEIGSHGVGHRPLTGLHAEDVARELLESRLTLEERLDRPVHAMSYPYGDVDGVVEHLAGAAGYLYGLTCRSAVTTFNDSLISLPRVEVPGPGSFEQFVRAVGR